MNLKKIYCILALVLLPFTSLSVNAQEPQISKGFVAEYQRLLDFAENYQIEVSLTSIKLNSASGLSTTNSEASCTVTVTVSILGQSAEVSATAATCEEALAMVMKGVASVV